MHAHHSIDYKPAVTKGGYTDRILHVDLSTSQIDIWEMPSDYKDKYVGGRGYALALIWEKTRAETRYDSPENLLVMASGPLCGDPRFPGSGKFIVGSISPLTDTFIDSNIGGHFAPLLKRCGFDALAVSGISSEGEKVLQIDGDEGAIRIVDAPFFGNGIDDGGLSYGESLLKQLYGDELDEHAAVVTTGKEAYQTLCDAVYPAKGYTKDGVPLPETLERFGLLDEKAVSLLSEYGLGWRSDRRLSN